MKTPIQLTGERHSRLEDFICPRCHCEAINTNDRGCQFCEALGKLAEKLETPFRFGELFGLQTAKPQTPPLPFIKKKTLEKECFSNA